jgi:hypothetical protein
LTLPYGDFSLHNRSQLIKLYETNRAFSEGQYFEVCFVVFGGYV